MYYLKKKGKVLGPFHLEKLQEMAVSGRVLPEHQISPDRRLWVAAAKIKEIFPELAAAEEPAPAPAPAPTPPSDAAANTPPPSLDIEPPPLDSPPPVVESIPKPLSVRKVPEPSYPEGLSPPPVQEDVVVIENTKGVQDLASSGSKTPKLNPLSILWNPVLFSSNWVNLDTEKGAFLFAGGGLLVFSWLSLAAAASIFLDPLGTWTIRLKGACVAALPPILLLISSTIACKLFSSSREWFLKENILLAGAALSPASLSLLVVSVMHRLAWLSPVQDVVLLAGLSIYAMAYFIVLEFNVFSRVFRMTGAGLVFVIGSVLLATASVTGFIYKLLSTV